MCVLLDSCKETLAVFSCRVEVWLEAILSHVVTSETLKWSWRWGRLLSCWLFSGLLQWLFLSCGTFRMLGWLKHCFWMHHNKTSVEILGSKLFGSVKKQNWWFLLCLLLVFWQVGLLYQVCCFRKLCARRNPVSVSQQVLRNVFVAFSKYTYHQSVYLEGKYVISGEHWNLQDYLWYKMYASYVTVLNYLTNSCQWGTRGVIILICMLFVLCFVCCRW